ncbi:MAG TPA: hypothetical protein DD417_20695 [Elusimicrobia bacterium]|nr:hypothetical protein [Elusimicrobiota bacterium]
MHYALKAAQGANRRGHACSVWGLEGRYPVLEAQRRGIPTRGYSHPWLDLPALRRFLKEDGTQLLVAHTGAGHSLAVAAAWSGGAGIPVIRTRGDARPLRRRPGAGLLWSRTAGFIAANQVILDQFRELFGPEIPAAVVYEGREDPGPARPPANTAPTVGIVARLDPVKGHSVFLEAAAAAARTCPEARFLVVGREENVRSAELRELAHRLGIAERTDFTGVVPDALEYMRRCHVGVIASLGSEAISRAAVEWMAVGRPLVSTRVGCLTEYVLEGRTGLLVPPGDPAALGAAMTALLRDVFLRERLGQAGRRRYEEQFTMDRFLEETERIYARAIRHPAHR